MNRLFLGKPSEQIIYEIKTRGKLVFHLNNGKYITFTKEELGSRVNMLEITSEGNRWADSVDIEPFKTKMQNAGVTPARSSIIQVIDRGNLINSVGYCGCSFYNMTKVYLPNCTRIRQFAFWNCRFLTNVYLPKVDFPYISYVYDRTNSAFTGCSSLKSVCFPNATIMSNCWNFFTECSSLEEIKMDNLKNFTMNHLGETGMFTGCNNLKKLSFPKLEGITNTFRTGNCGIEEIYFPNISVISISNVSTCFTGATKCTKATFGKLPIATIQANNAYGLPSGCHIYGKDGDYIV